MIRRRGLGDALVSLRAVLELASATPQATIDWLIDRPFAPLFEKLIDDEHLLLWPPTDSVIPGGWLGCLRSQAYDLVIDLLSTPRTAMWTALSGAPLRLGYDLPWRRWAYNLRVPRNREGTLILHQFAGESFLDPLRHLGLAPEPWRPTDLAVAEDQDLDSFYRRWRDRSLSAASWKVALVLSAGWPAKAWPLREAVELARRLRRRGWQPVLCPGPGDEALAAEFRERDSELTIAPRTGLRELADLLRRCDCYLGTDGGARHVAAAVGLPTCTLFGPTNAAGWNPEDPRHVSVRTGEPCSPCDLKVCPLADHPCMTQMTADRVEAALEAFLARNGLIGHDDAYRKGER